MPKNIMERGLAFESHFNGSEKEKQGETEKESEN
jgi:hypothetical protein